MDVIVYFDHFEESISFKLKMHYGPPWRPLNSLENYNPQFYDSVEKAYKYLRRRDGLSYKIYRAN